MTEFSKVVARRDPPPPGAIEAAVRVLEAGGLLVHPTATVYGIGGRPGTEVEVARLKRRPPARPIIFLVRDRRSASRLFPALRWNRLSVRLADAFWPGSLTLVVEDGTSRGTAIRAEPHPAIRALLDAWDGALGSTSLNRSGETPAHRPAEARSVLARLPSLACPVLLLDAGPLPGGPPSTVVAVRGGSLEVLREGAVPEREIRAAAAVGGDA